MKGTNTLHINQATMVEAMNLWLADQFKNPPVATKVKEGDKNRHNDGFTVIIQTPDQAAK